MRGGKGGWREGNAKGGEERVEREYRVEGEGIAKEEKVEGGRSRRRGSREEDT